MQSELNSWQKSLAQSITDVKQLCDLLKLSDEQTQPILANSSFPLRVSREFISRIKPGDSDDPLLKQILPLAKELDTFPGYSQDPLGEKDYNPIPGLLHKYSSRVLLTLTGGCAINCRYCFRRHFPYADNSPGTKGWDKAIEYIAANPQIEEVIFSGGDPLVVKDSLLADLCNKLATIPHLRRLRIHTRLPIMIPSRVNTELLAWLTGTRLQPIVFIHSNHPNEIDDKVSEALNKLRTANINLLNQSVLLKGVNDSSEVLLELSRKLFANGVLPYYLHLLDPVQGAEHFAIDDQTAVRLMRSLTQIASGYLVPKLVREVAGGSSKVIIPIF